MTLSEIVCNNVQRVENTVAFIGAGLSVKAGLPTWADLVKRIVDHIESIGFHQTRVQYYRLLCEEKKFLQLFENVHDDMAPGQYLQMLEKLLLLETHYVQEHEDLVRIPFAGIITTNFDRLIEEAYTVAHHKSAFCQTYENNGIRALMAHEGFFIFKLHGDIQQIADIVLRKSQYDRIRGDAHIADLLKKYITQYQFVFIGYSFSDPDFESVWNLINDHWTLKKPGIIITQNKEFDDKWKQKLSNQNIVVIESEKYDGSYKFVAEVLHFFATGLCKKITSRTEEQLFDPELLETSFMLVELFDKTTESTQVKFLRSILISLLLNKRMESHDLIKAVAEKLTISAHSIEEKINKIVSELQKEDIIQYEGSIVQLNESSRARYLEQKRSFYDRIVTVTKQVIERVIVENQQKEIEKDSKLLFEALLILVQEHGKRLSECVIFYRRFEPEERTFVETISRFLKLHNKDDKRQLIVASIKELINNSRVEEEHVLFKLLQMYFLTSSYVLNINNERLLKDYVRQFVTYFDSNIILQALIEFHPHNEISVRLIEKTRSLGIELRVLDVIFEEIVFHTAAALNLYSDVISNAGDPKDAVEGYIEISKEACNAWIRGFQGFLQSRPKSTWSQYVQHITMDNQNNVVDKDKLKMELRNKWGIHVIDSNLSTHEATRVGQLKNEIENFRKFGKKDVRPILCEHEAKQFIVIYRERQSPGLEDKVWFISNDHFISQLQQKHRDEFVIPCSYTPVGWYQYLQLLDFDSRASKNFGRLFMFADIGAFDETLALTTMKELLRRDSQLKELGIGIKDFARELTSNYHIDQQIRNLSRQQHHGRVVTPKEFANVIERTIEKAIGEFVSVKKSDIKKHEKTTEDLRAAETKLKQERGKRKQLNREKLYLQKLVKGKKKKKS